ncbi:CvfB family protein [Lentiprolixibacter aurantiacus]|uniref:S1-like domain-containing RNA-binding protein n=1 Tax=Lentiprolixibacter aurantiacus TaxID=2993939 RepID=A0AAE3MM70_9FLAO|nr:S1-like domain-containing RNA-binding protein [Lentiprolixibacter aurantiacus]MCX2719439.1 S1-like domain-containing RNA-binding protein [Lentiprolixibacter aurantiacus]
MIELGNYNTLKILRSTRVGLFLGDADVDDLLLPNKYVPEHFEIGQELRVFCYLDQEERPVATTGTPNITRNSFAFLEVAEVNDYGAFLDWGLDKHLFVPFREQPDRMESGKRYVVYCFLDPKSQRLVASGRWWKFLDNTSLELRAGEKVELIVARRSDLGWDVIVNNKHRGLVFHNQVHRKLQTGDRLPGYIRQIREDQKLDVVLEPLGREKLEPAALKVFTLLGERGGVLHLHDKSDPQEIRQQLDMSKKTFKKAIGTLYKQKKIEIRTDGIYLVAQ